MGEPVKTKQKTCKSEPNSLWQPKATCEMQSGLVSRLTNSEISPQTRFYKTFYLTPEERFFFAFYAGSNKKKKKTQKRGNTFQWFYFHKEKILLNNKKILDGIRKPIMLVYL